MISVGVGGVCQISGMFFGGLFFQWGVLLVLYMAFCFRFRRSVITFVVL